MATKRMFIAVIILVAFCTASFSGESVASGPTHSALGNYSIAIAEKPVVMNGEQLRSYVITYDNSPLQVTVALKKDKKSLDYIVLSDKLSVKYVSNGIYFGVQKLQNKDGLTTSDEALNRIEYFHQKLITQGQLNELESAQLIAVYFPMLISDKLTAAK